MKKIKQCKPFPILPVWFHFPSFQRASDIAAELIFTLFHDMMTSHTLHKCLLVVLDIPEIQLYSCETWQNFCLIYLISSTAISILPCSSQVFKILPLLFFIHLHFCPLKCFQQYFPFTYFSKFFMTTWASISSSVLKRPYPNKSFLVMFN